MIAAVESRIDVHPELIAVRLILEVLRIEAFAHLRITIRGVSIQFSGTTVRASWSVARERRIAASGHPEPVVFPEPDGAPVRVRPEVWAALALQLLEFFAAVVRPAAPMRHLIP